MNCYDCKWRQDLIGDAHSQCCIDGNIYRSLLATGLGKTPKFNPHGVKNGWAGWPFSFDPIWIETCPFLSRKEDAHETKQQRDPVSESGEKPVPNANEAGGCIAETTTTSKYPNGERPTGVGKLHEESQ